MAHRASVRPALLAVIAAAVLSLGACSGSDSPGDDAPSDGEGSTTASHLPCLEGSEAVPSVEVKAATVGDGPNAVVLVNGSGETACSWGYFVAAATAAGHRAYVYDQASDGGPLEERRAELRQVVRAAKEAGAERVVLVGSSRGGCLSLIEASSNKDVSGVAVLSCARAWNQDDPVPLAPYLPKVRVPVVEVVAKDDPSVPVADVRKDWKAIPGSGPMWQLPGTVHGVWLLDDERVADRVLQLVAGE